MEFLLEIVFEIYLELMMFILPEKKASTKKYRIITALVAAIYGLVSVEALLKEVDCSVIGTDDFCDITDMAIGDLVYPLALAMVINAREKFDWLYIDDISNPDRRFTAREINRRIKCGAGVRIINTDTNYVEQLLAPSQEVK